MSATPKLALAEGRGGGGFFGPGPGPATQEAMDSIRPYLSGDARA